MTLLISLLAATTFAQTPTPAPDAPRLLAQPTVHGNTVVFSYGGDLWSTTLTGGEAKRLTSGYGNKAAPFISPDGTQIAFTAAYDGEANVYTIPIGGGAPVRLTYDSSPDTVLGWTPDGKVAYRTAAFAPYQQRQQEMFTVSPQGGMPSATPVKEVYWASFFPHSSQIAYTRFPSFLFNWRRYRGGTQGFVSLYNLADNTYSELPHGREQQYYPMATENDIYFVSDKGDGVLNLYQYNLKGKSSKKLTAFTGEDIKWANSDGKHIVFSQDGYLWLFDIATGEYHTMSPKIVTDELLTRSRIVQAASALSISPSGARIAIEGRGHVFTVPEHPGFTRDLTTGGGMREQAPAWSPDGQSVAFISDATGETEVYTRPQLGGPATQLTTFGTTITGFNYSPDGKTLAVQTVHNDFYTVDVATKKVTLVEHSLYGIGGSDWSPDSRWIAFTDGKATSTTTLRLYNLGNHMTANITDGMYQDSEVAFDQTGKYLYLLSARTIMPTPGLFGPDLKIENAQRLYAFTLAKDTPDPLSPVNEEEPSKDGPTAPAGGKPKPPLGSAGSGAYGPPKGGAGGPGPSMAPLTLKIDLDGLGKRIIPLPLPPGMYAGLVGMENGVLYAAPGGVFRFDFGTKSSVPVILGPVQAISLNPSRTKLAYYGAGTIGEIPIGPPATVGAGKIDVSGIEFTLHPRQEWKQIYWEAWRFIRDNYYDENFRGQNWKAIGDHFAAMLPYCASRSDLNTILGLLLSQLGTSHAYIEGPGDLGPAPRLVPVGYLGADYEVSGNAVKFAKIYRGETDIETNGGPLGLPGVNVNEGDYLLAIDGKDVNAHTNPTSLLIDKVGKMVQLTVNSSPTTAGARTVWVKPIATEIQIRYIDFLERSRAAVEKASDGRIGYMHIRDTAMTGSEDFARAFNALTDKDALIVDERWNGGGYPDPKFVEALALKSYSYGQQRQGGDAQITPSMVGPQAMLINSYAGSGGDLFPWTFKQAGLGPLIGMRTWGGLVGIGDGAHLVDGGSISTPSFSVYDPKVNEIIAENHGIDPDIKVDNRPDLVAKGEDPQLEAAIKYLMDKLAKMPPRKPREKLPAVNKDGLISK